MAKCNECLDGELYPYYGVAPHDHVPGPMIGSTVLRDKKTWPDNFVPDSEDAGCGVYFCPSCRAGLPTPPAPGTEGE